MKKIVALLTVFMMAVSLVPFGTVAVAAGNCTEQTCSTPDESNSVLLDDSNVIELESETKSAAPLIGSDKTPAPALEGEAVSEKDFSEMTKAEMLSLADNLPVREFVPMAERHLVDESRGLTGIEDSQEHADLYEKIVERSAEMERKIAKGHELAADKEESKATVVDNVVLITNETELKAIAEQEGYYRLTCDIVLTSWMPISFYGFLEGAGYKIIGLDVQMNEYDYVGFFDNIGPDATVQNLTIVAPTIYGNSTVGALCAYNEGTISNCHVKGGIVISYMWADFEQSYWTISGCYVGGLVGSNYGMISDCTSSADVDGWVSCGGLVGENYGYIFFSLSTGNVCFETNIYDVDYYGVSYYEYYGYSEYPIFTTVLRMQWAAAALYDYECVSYGYNGGLVGANYYYVVDSYVQGRGVGTNYGVGVVAGLTGVGGLVGGDVGYSAHCYAVDRAFPLFEDGSELYYPWDLGDEGYGIYYDWDAILVHMGIGFNGGVSDAESEIFCYMNSQGPACDDDTYHGDYLTAEQFMTASTYANWNHAEWNAMDVWYIVDGAVPFITPCPIQPSEWVISYEVANAGGLLDGAYIVYKCVPNYADGLATEPAPPMETDTANGMGIEIWSPTTPYLGKPIGSDMNYLAYFGKVSVRRGDATNDGNVNTGDVVQILRYCVNIVSLDTQQLRNADANKDGKVNTGDATLVLRYTAGLVHSL